MSAPCTAEAWNLTAHQGERITKKLHPVPLRPFWPWVPTRFYAAPGLVMYVSGGGTDGGVEVKAGAPHRIALQLLLDADVEWFRFEG